MESVKVIINNKTYNYPKNTTLYKISEDFKDEFNNDILIAKMNGEIVWLNEQVISPSKIEFFDVSSKIGSKAYERTAILILVKAVKDVMGKDVRVEYSIDKGIYCTVKGLDINTLTLIHERMNEIIDASYKIEKLNTNRLNTIKYYEKNRMYDKAELLKYISNTYVTIYKLDDVYDYMYGDMLINTAYINEFNLEYVGSNGFVLMLPFIYNENKVSSYTHHEDLFNTKEEYNKWCHKIGINNITDVNKKLSEGKFNDLIFMSEARQNNELFNIAHKIASNKNIKMVLISGPSSSGKTTTSRKLKLFLESEGLKPYALSVDDYFLERDETPVDENGKRDYESVNALDINLFNKQLEEILDGKEVILPTFNFISGKKEFKKKFRLQPNGILIIEGLHSLNDELTSKINTSNKFKIYLSPLTCLNLDNHNRLNTTDNRLLRRMVRDNLRRGYNASETLESWPRVRHGETKYVFPYQDSADVVLNTSLIYEINVLKVYAEPLLFSVEENDPNYREAIRLINILRMALPMPAALVPHDSILREFIGNGCFDE